MEELRKSGFEIVLRSAGSHSVVDVIGIDPGRKRIHLVQCKSGAAMGELATLEALLTHLTGTYEVLAYGK